MRFSRNKELIMPCMNIGCSIPFFIITFLSCHSAVEPSIKMKGSCDALLDTFAAKTAVFTYCAIKNARPITFCENCVSEYIDVLQAYQEIYEMTDETGQPCKIKLLNSDRVATIEVIFKSVSQLWDRGACTYCFVLSSNGTLTNELRNSTKEFNRRYSIVKQCIDEHENDTVTPVCTTCHAPYTTINEYFNTIKLKASENENDNMCMDVVDLMNSTRSKWSRELHCLPAHHSELPLLISAGFMLATPVVFYLFSMWFSRSFPV